MAEKTSARSELHHFVFPTVYLACYQVEVINNPEQLYPVEADHSTSALYQMLDKIVLDRYSNFNGGVRATFKPDARNNEKFNVEYWSDVSNTFVPPMSHPFHWLIKDKNTEKEKEKEKQTTTPTNKDILVSRLECLLSNEQFGYRLGCISNHSFNFMRSDGSRHYGALPEHKEDRAMIQKLQHDYTNAVKKFINLVLEVIDEDGKNKDFSLHMAAHVCNDSTDTERDEFLAIVTPNKKTVIMIGLFYYRFYG